MELSGTILTGPDFEARDGRVHIDDGEIEAVETASVYSNDIVLPAFVNAHTHIGDSIAKEAGEGLSLEELVAPPDGLKHRLLGDATRMELIDAMADTVEFMREGGTTAFLDFREGGRDGIEAFRAATEGSDIEGLAFGRGESSVLDVADGYGASGVRDAEFSGQRAAAREAGKPFAIHAGERDPHDIDAALDLDPAFVVHMVHAFDHHLDRLADDGPPVVVCPRSNLVTGVGTPPVAALLERTDVALGTDNAMLNAPSMFREMEFTAKLFDVTAKEVLRMATTAGARLAGMNCGVVEPGRAARLLVLDGESANLRNARDPVRAVVRRASVADVKRVVAP
ncbi:MAG: amidohydrolase family protein [Natronomonas sp.]